MKDHRIYNFNPGPAALPLPVLEEIQESFLNFAGTGMSIVEVPHGEGTVDRAAFAEILSDDVAAVAAFVGDSPISATDENAFPGSRKHAV